MEDVVHSNAMVVRVVHPPDVVELLHVAYLADVFYMLENDLYAVGVTRCINEAGVLDTV